jgi:hypothetical protein
VIFIEEPQSAAFMSDFHKGATVCGSHRVIFIREPQSAAPMSDFHKVATVCGSHRICVVGSHSLWLPLIFENMRHIQELLTMSKIWENIIINIIHTAFFFLMAS